MLEEREQNVCVRVSKNTIKMFLTFGCHLTSADVLINHIRCSGCGRGPVQFHCGSVRFE